MEDVILVANAGSSSLKIAIFTTNGKEISEALYRILLETKDGKLLFRVKNAEKSYLVDTKPIEGDIIDSMIKAFAEWWDDTQSDLNLIATGHRIVHGGRIFSQPVIVTDLVTKQIADLIPLDPLHQPYNLLALNLFRQQYPNLMHVACFDTAFHTTQSRLAESFGIAKKFYDEGIYRYGFHGLSYQWISQNFENIAKQELPKRTIVAHLGNGSSMCAIKDGISVANSMGFSVIEGLMMGTRCGSMDPGVIFYLANHQKMPLEQIETLLYKQSGLLGVSGESADVRTLLDSKSPDAKFAIDLFAYKGQLEIGRLSAALGGLDCLIFTAGIGENSAIIRNLITKDLEWLGVKLDQQKNQKNEQSISTEDSLVKVFAIPTNEERVIAQNVSSIAFKG